MGKMKEAATEAAAAPCLIVFGKDEAGKAHASWFAEPEAELAERAAGLMAMSVLRLTTDEHRAAASDIAAGRVFASGKAFVPFAKGAAYDRLAGFPEAYLAAAPAEPEPLAPVPAITAVPLTRDAIEAGSLVLAPEEEVLGWFEAVVVEIKPDALFVLRWLDWPDVPSFVRRGDNLALLPPIHDDYDAPAP